MPDLYIVATPIGNLEDITLRAVRVLGEVGLIAAEDTRVTRKLLTRYDIHTPLTSYYEHNKRSKLPSLLAALAEKDIALVTDAGTPGVSDPGYELVRAASDAGVRVVPIPGASAITSAIAVSGLPADRFVYLGFLPRRRSERLELLGSLTTERRAMVALETPHRLRAALEDLLETLGDRRIAAGRELTKLHEEVFRGAVSEALEKFVAPRGEFTLVIEGAAESVTPASPEAARELLTRYREEGLGAKESVARAAGESGVSRRDAYRLWLEVDKAAREQL
jgi:16S rRNA (cytidine1402-2'-O)-methyltransferase